MRMDMLYFLHQLLRLSVWQSKKRITIQSAKTRIRPSKHRLATRAYPSRKRRPRLRTASRVLRGRFIQSGVKRSAEYLPETTSAIADRFPTGICESLHGPCAQLQSAARFSVSDTDCFKAAFCRCSARLAERGTGFRAYADRVPHRRRTGLGSHSACAVCAALLVQEDV